MADQYIEYPGAVINGTVQSQIVFELNGVPTQVAEDQTNPANNKPLPIHDLRRPLEFVRNDYTGTPVTTLAYTQLIAATSGYATQLDIFDSSGETMVIAFGGAGSEVNQFLVTPGGVGPYNIAIPAGTRISIKAISATASVGEFDMNLFQ